MPTDKMYTGASVVRNAQQPKLYSDKNLDEWSAVFIIDQDVDSVLTGSDKCASHTASGIYDRIDIYQ